VPRPRSPNLEPKILALRDRDWGTDNLLDAGREELLPLISGRMLGQELMEREDLTLAIRDGRDSAGTVTSDGVAMDGVCGVSLAVPTVDTSVISTSDSGMCEFRSRERGEAGGGRPEGGDGERDMEKRAARERNLFCILLLADVGFGEEGVEDEIIRPPSLEICSM
jgi:hypothetical protein